MENTLSIIASAVFFVACFVFLYTMLLFVVDVLNAILKTVRNAPFKIGFMGHIITASLSFAYIMIFLFVL